MFFVLKKTYAALCSRFRTATVAEEDGFSDSWTVGLPHDADLCMHEFPWTMMKRLLIWYVSYG
jgi:hypothetical protein